MASSSSAPPRKYEVFLSFRGEDTRNTFVSHLHTALDQRGIVTYMDEYNLQKGQSISPELMKSIEESEVAIIVFSKTYASSTWCLDELVKIMDCKNTYGKTVIPIFYDVDPSDVRKQKNSYGESFSIHELNFKDNMEKVQIWKENLYKAASLTGVDIRGRKEASCIKEIVEDIFWKLRPKPASTNKDLVGIESRMTILDSLLFKELDGVCFVGIWGMGGSGKTTIATAIFEKHIGRFEGGCFLQDVNKAKMEDLQNILLSKVLNMESGKVTYENEGRRFIKERFCSKKVLLVLDDVNHLNQLKSLAAEPDWFGSGSRIIITTRDEELLNDVNGTYKVDLLSDDEAMHLFCWHAFKQSHPAQFFFELSKRVVSYAGGLPLALKVLGSHLHRKKIDVWESVLDRLKDAPEEDIFSVLKISFDGLSDIQKETFLDIACFFREWKEHNVKERLRSCGFHPVESISVLIQRSLIYILHEEIQMHDLIQEMGQHIVRQKANKRLERYSRLWLRNDICNVLTNNTGTAKIEALVLRGKCEIISGEGTVKEQVYEINLLSKGAFRKMNKLRLLDILDFQPIFTGDLEYLPNTLQWLSWPHYPGKYLPKDFRPINLVHLDLTWSSIVETPDVSGMPNLEVLDLTKCYDLLKVHPSIGVHKKLVRLDLSGCYNLEKFPRIIQMESLEILDLSWCSEFLSLPEIHRNTSRLRILTLSYTKIEELPWSFGGLTNLQELYLRGCKDLRGLPSNLCGLEHLEIINLGGCSKLEYFFENPDGDEAVPSFDLQPLPLKRKRVEYHGPSKNVNMFSALLSLPSLRTLDMSNCNVSEVIIPESIGCLASLQELDLSYNNFVSLPESINRLTCLQFLGLRYCDMLEALPELPSSIKVLDLDPSRALTRIPSLEDLFGKSEDLHYLSLEGCEHLLKNLGINLSRAFRKMNKLRLLDLLTKDSKFSPDSGYLLNKIQRFSFPRYPGKYLSKHFRPINLVHLDLTDSSIVETPDVSSMPNLEVLDLHYCFELLEVHPSIGVHKKLVHLDLSGCCKLEKFPRIIQMESLEILNLSWCSEFHSLPEIHRNTSRLRILTLSYTKIEELPWSFGGLTNLQELYLRGCQDLRGLPSSLCGLEHLETINLGGCSKLEYFFENPDGDEAVPSFDLQPLPLKRKRVEYHGPSKNVNMFSTLLSLPSLRTLDMSNCNVSEKVIIPESIGCLASLQELDLSGNNFVSLPESINCFTCLQFLRLRYCDMLESLPELPSSIMVLDLAHCRALTRIPSLVDLLSKYEDLRYLSLEGCEQLLKNPGINLCREFREMNKLRPLDLLTKESKFSADYGFQLNEIQGFSFPRYPGKYFSKYFQPINLVGLNLTYSSIVETPDISGMPNLEVLDLQCCFELLEVHPSIGVHKKLVRLNLSCCYKLEKFPRIIQMESLEIADLSRCLKFHSFPEIHRNTSRLRILNLVNTKIEELPWSFGGLTSLQELYLSSCKDLRGLPSSLCGLQHLEVIDLYGCSKIEYFFENPDGDEAVSCFDSQPLPLKRKNVNMFSALLSLPSLRTLDMGNCNVSEVIIPESIGCVRSLQELYLDCNNFVSLPGSINCISCLQILDLNDCKMLEALPELLSSIKELHLEGCTALTRIPSLVDLLGKCKDLHHLSLLGCEQLVKNTTFATIVIVDHNPQTDALHQSRPQFSLAFWDWRSVSNILCNKQEVVHVCLPRIEIPDWLYPSRWAQVMTTLSPFWYNDKLRGFALCANADCFDFKLHTCNGLVYNLGGSYCSLNKWTAFWYIPISTIDREWKDQKGSFLFEVINAQWNDSYDLTSWGIRLVYEGEVDQDISHLTITNHYGPMNEGEHPRLKVCVATRNHEEKEVVPAMGNIPTSEKPRFKLFGRYI